jgi:septum formation protein
MTGHPQRLILASASPRRRELLERMGLHFVIRPAEVDEDNRPRQGPAAMVAANALLKAGAVSREVPEALVLGSDTTVALDEEVLNKPADLAEARAMLRRLCGRRHVVYTAVALLWRQGGFEDSFVEASDVHFKAFDEAVIERYFEAVDPLDKAGAYGIQQARELIIDRVGGSVENVMGLPIQMLARKLAEHGFNFRS